MNLDKNHSIELNVDMKLTKSQHYMKLSQDHSTCLTTLTCNLIRLSQVFELSQTDHAKVEAGVEEEASSK